MNDLIAGSAERFVDAARVAHGEGRPFVIEAAAVLQIAADPAETIRFRRLVRELNDPELRDLIGTYLGTLRRDENRRARAADLWGDNIKLGVGSIGLGTVVTGMVAVARRRERRAVSP